MAKGDLRTLAALLLGATATANAPAFALSAQPSQSAEPGRSVLDATARPDAAARNGQQNGAKPRDIYGRSATALSLEELGVNPSLRFEFGQAAIRPVDAGIEADGLTSTQRAELGLVDDTERLYDAALRFDAARIGDVHLVMRGGVRTVAGGSQQTDLTGANGMGELRWRPSRARGSAPAP